MFSPKVRSILTVIATVIAAVGGVLVQVDGIPDWIGIVVAASGAAFGSLGIIPPQVGGTQEGVLNPTAIDVPPSSNIQPGSGERGEVQVGLTAVLLIIIIILLIIFIF